MLALSAAGAPPAIRSPTQGVELVDRPDPLSRQVRSPFLQQRKHHCYVLGNDFRSVTLNRRNTRGRSSVDHVGLTSSTPRGP